jgi:hypothetical protein
MAWGRILSNKRISNDMVCITAVRLQIEQNQLVSDIA